MTSRVWTASQYVDELRRRRDASFAEATGCALSEPRKAFGARVAGRVYEECAALAELTADPQARGPVLDAVAALHAQAVESVQDALSALGSAARAIEAGPTRGVIEPSCAADPQAPVLDALAVLHSCARDVSALLADEPHDGFWECALQCAVENLALASDAVDAALDARRTLPEVVHALPHRDETAHCHWDGPGSEKMNVEERIGRYINDLYDCCRAGGDYAPFPCTRGRW